ncbi:mycothiol transferase [Sanguibacter suarezii]|uniref:mycothiol transferase n=1 Tax=Sanguibacter suarezii TaxID=60921 RepID=UPI00083068FE|nr:DUF664 domain-containing protein [Sanguibacter suarezii]
MSSAIEVLSGQYETIGEGVAAVVEGLTPEQLAHHVAPGANTIGWLVWHLLRVQDDHVSDVADREQVWTSGGWVDRFGLPFERDATGYGQSAAEVDAVRTEAGLLAGYGAEVLAATQSFLAGLSEPDLDRIVDESWDPPVSLGVRLQSVIGDDLKHLGQAELLRGLL